MSLGKLVSSADASLQGSGKWIAVVDGGEFLMIGSAIALMLAQPAAGAWCAVIAQEQGTGVSIFSSDGRHIGDVPVGTRPHEVEIAPDRRTAFVSQFGITDYDSRIGTPGDHVSRIDLRTAKESGRYELPKGLRAPHGVKIRPGNRELFVNAEDGGDTMLVFDIVSRRVLRRFPLVAGSHNFIFSRDGRSVLVFAGAGGIARYDPDSGRLRKRVDVGSPVRGLQLTNDGDLAAGAKGEVVLLSANALRVIRRLPAPVKGQLLYPETSGDGTIVVASPSDGGVAIFSPGRETRFVRTGRSPIIVRRAPDDRLLVANADDDHVSKLDVDTASAGAFATMTSPNGIGFGECPAPTEPTQAAAGSNL